jgi:hypothetical protein
LQYSFVSNRVVFLFCIKFLGFKIHYGGISADIGAISRFLYSIKEDESLKVFLPRILQANRSVHLILALGIGVAMNITNIVVMIAKTTLLSIQAFITGFDNIRRDVITQRIFHNHTHAVVTRGLLGELSSGGALKV